MFQKLKKNKNIKFYNYFLSFIHTFEVILSILQMHTRIEVLGRGRVLIHYRSWDTFSKLLATKFALRKIIVNKMYTYLELPKHFGSWDDVLEERMRGKSWIRTIMWTTFLQSFYVEIYKSF